MFGLSLRKITQGLAEDAVDSIKDSGQLERNLNVLAESIASLSKSTNTLSASGESESYKGSEGDIKINKTGHDRYDFLIRGQDGWHKDNNASFGPLDENKDLEDPPTVNMTSGNFDYSYEGNTRLSLNLDPSKSSTSSIATPVIKGFGNLKIESTGTTILQSALRLSSVAASGSDTDKFLNIDSSGNLGYRTGAQLLSDVGAASTTLASAKALVGNGSNVATAVSLSSDVTMNNAGAVTIANDAVTYAKIQNVSATDRILGRDSASAGVIEEITPANLRTMINVEDGATADQTRADVEALAVREVGILATGSITSSFGAIDNGSDAITTTGLVTSGTSLVAGATLTASDVGDTTALKITQTLNAASGTNAGLAAENYSALQMNITETDSAGFDNQNFINCEGAGVGTTEKFKVALDGNVTSVGKVTSTHGVCGGTRHFIQAGFNYSSTAGTLVYVPINGYIIESAGSSGRNEYQTFVAPYRGYVNQVIVRSEEACGSTSVGLHKSATGTEIPNTTAVGVTTLDMAADDTAYKFDFAGGISSGSNAFDAGDILAISFDPTNDANDTVCTIELIFNIDIGL